MTTRLRTLAVVLLVVGGLGYADWVLQLVVPVDADLRTSFISELSAVGQPYHQVFRIADIVAGVALGAGAALSWALTRRTAAVWAPLLVLAVCAVVEAAVPLSTSYTFGSALPDPGTSAWWAKVSEPHGVSSFLETLAFLLVLLTCSLALRRDGADRRRLTLLAVGLGAALCGAIDAVLTATLLLNGSAALLGLVQRLGVTLTAVWLAAAPTWLLLLPDQGSRASRSATSTRRPV
ncbi:MULTISPECIES: DUF998 domain-containing protein [unclassified Nocardioides]|uniref:DUF998 domain-containing protein n=1 Tax=unclassified Nocardioides TaxID=2615069 RepID=UPI001357FB50|nr:MULTISPECIES: DUF998 domain-containing protein [unclassified Nocardioides]WGY03284.1 DUF998 domain-containing protein [Nocardioides sp. QY071]